MLPIIFNKMLNNTTTQALQEQSLPMNLIGLMTTPTYQVENPIHEIQEFYNVSEEYAYDIYEQLGDAYTCERAVQSLGFSVKGGASC